MDAALEARLTLMEQKIAELERENQSLRAAATSTKEDPKEGEVLPRREVLKGAAYALGAVSLSLLGTRPAEATEGFMRYGVNQHAGTSPTGLYSTATSWTLGVSNLLQGQGDPFRGVALVAASYGGHAVYASLTGTGAVGDGVNVSAEGFGHGVKVAKFGRGSFGDGDGVNVSVEGFGHGVNVVKPGEFGHCVLGFQNSPVSLYAALAGVTQGAGPGLHGRGEGTGNGVWGEVRGLTKTQSAVLGTTTGTGAAIEGNSSAGRGGVFRGKKAQVRFVPSSATTKPTTGQRGDLFVDSSGRLWYCKTGGSVTGWRQFA
jgi:hypothetical protein